MKTNLLTPSFLLLCCCLAFQSGCATTSGDKAAKTDAEGFVKDQDLQRVWLAPNFDFNGYDTLFIPEPQATATSQSDEEARVLATARRTLREELAARLADTKVFKNVVTRETDIPPGSKALNLAMDIYKHEKGGGGARYFAGLYGAGQPVLKVRGHLRDGATDVFRFDSERSGDSAGARMGGAFRSDESIQTDDIRDLAKDMADFITRTAHHTPRK